MNSPNPKKNLALYGSSIVLDMDLREELVKNFEVYPCDSFEKLQLTLNKFTISIILFQIDNNEKELINLQFVVSFYPLIPILVIGDSKQMKTVAQAFEFGAKDFFKMPYPRELLVERAKVLARIEKSGRKNSSYNI